MCFRFDSCFGVHVHDDVDFPLPSATKNVAVPPPPRYAAASKTPAPAALRDGYYYTNGHHAQQGGNHQPPHADDEASRRKRPAAAPAAVPAVGGHGYAAGGDEALKHPAARNSKAVGQHGAGNGAQRYYYEHEQPARKDVATKDYYYPTPSATSDLERY